jgi:hypothetical protein
MCFLSFAKKKKEKEREGERKKVREREGEKERERGKYRKKVKVVFVFGVASQNNFCRLLLLLKQDLLQFEAVVVAQPNRSFLDLRFLFLFSFVFLIEFVTSVFILITFFQDGFAGKKMQSKLGYTSNIKSAIHFTWSL